MTRSKPSRPTRRTTQPPTDDTMRQFTVKSWAVTAGVLKSRRDVDVVLDLLGFFDWLGDQNMQSMRRTLPTPACRAGCAFCCYVGADRPDLLPVEVLRIARYLEARPEEKKPIAARLLEETAGFAEKPDVLTKTPCLFLRQDRCTVYPVRPLRCRAQTSPDAVLCEQNYRGRRETMPLLKEPALLYRSLQMGLRMGLRDLGVQDMPLRMTSAVRLAWDASPAWRRWLDGEAVFAPAVFPEPAEEAQTIAQFMRQNRVQLGVERETMQRIITACVNAPGTWARYVDK
ncbi:MAG: YkgJ family cysteine cluster protein [Anaerolineae bacterium]|nr:YkgJ family cysteine cluster protein [Anaerolineae bacterium]